MRTNSIIVCEGDQTGQELLNEALRVLEPSVLGFDVDLVRFDLSWRIVAPPTTWSSTTRPRPWSKQVWV